MANQTVLVWGPAQSVCIHEVLIAPLPVHPGDELVGLNLSVIFIQGGLERPVKFSV